MSDMTFTLYLKPEPQGSTRAFVCKMKSGKLRAAVTSDNAKLKPYRHALTQIAMEAMSQNALECPLAASGVAVAVDVVWTLAKPKSTPKRVTQPTKRPDADKLLRAVLDSLTGVAYSDDAQVVSVTAMKQYGAPESTTVTVRALEGATR